MTFDELVDDVCERLSLTSAEAIARVGKRINSRYKRVRTAIGLGDSARVQLTYNVVLSTRLQTIPDVEKVASVQNASLDPDSPPLVEISYEEMLGVVPGTGAPTRWAVKNTGARSVTLIFDTTFADATVLTIDARENTSTLSGSMEPEFEESFHEVLVYGAVSDELYKKEKSPLKKEADAEWERMLGELRLFRQASAWRDVQQGKYNLGDSGLNTRVLSGGGGGGGSTPSTEFFSDYFNVMDPAYGAANDGSHDDTAALQAAIADAAVAGGTVFIPAGLGCVVTADLTIPTGQGSTVSFLGANWETGGIIFSGAGVTKGLYFLGTTSFDYSGSVENLAIRCISGAARGVTFENVNHPRLVRSYISGADGAGVVFNDTLVGRMEQVLLTGCGSATEGSVEVDGGTTFVWDECRISGGDTTVGGLLIDRMDTFSMRGGAIESCGIPLKLVSKAEATFGVKHGSVTDLDLEAPGQYYVEAGYGWSGAAFVGVQNVVFDNINAVTSGATDVRYGFKLKNAIGTKFGPINVGLAGGSQTAIIWLEGATVLGTTTDAQRAAFGGTVPWVMANSVALSSATPLVNWTQQASSTYNQFVAKTGATPDIRISAQGGLYAGVTLTQGGATNLTQFVFGGDASGNSLYVLPGDSNTTFIESTAATQGTLKLLSGHDTAAVSGKMYHFVCDGTYWREVGAAKPARPLGNVTDVGTDADLAEKTLATFTIPANTLDTNLISGFTFWAAHTVVAAGGTIRVKIDGVTVATCAFGVIAVNGAENFTMQAVRSSNVLLELQYQFINGAAAGSVVSIAGGNTATVDCTAAITITITGQNDAVAAANRIQFNRGQLTFSGAPAASVL